MRSTILVAALSLALSLRASAQDISQTPPQRTEAEKRAFLNRVISNQKGVDAALDLYERIERLEIRKNSGDAKPFAVKLARVIPAGTGTGHIPLGPDGKPPDAASYRAELEKLERVLAWAAQSGRAQQDAYARVEKKRRERIELIDATREAFLFTFAARERRGDAILAKYRMDPNPAYKPTSRATAIFSKVRGVVWIDEDSGQLARIEGEVMDNISIGVILAKIYKGSYFMQERYEMAPGVWLPTYSQYDFDGRKLFLSFAIHERTFYTQYRRIGPPQEALQIIRAELGKPAAAPAGP